MPPVLFCPGFVVSRVCPVQGLSCPGFAESRVCLSRVCLSRVCRVQGLSVQGLSVQGLSVQGLSVYHYSEWTSRLVKLNFIHRKQKQEIPVRCFLLGNVLCTSEMTSAALLAYLLLLLCISFKQHCAEV
jgi:hypothetical protein